MECSVWEVCMASYYCTYHNDKHMSSSNAVVAIEFFSCDTR